MQGSARWRDRGGGRATLSRRKSTFWPGLLRLHWIIEIFIGLLIFFLDYWGFYLIIEVCYWIVDVFKELLRFYWIFVFFCLFIIEDFCFSILWINFTKILPLIVCSHFLWKIFRSNTKYQIYCTQIINSELSELSRCWVPWLSFCRFPSPWQQSGWFLGLFLLIYNIKKQECSKCKIWASFLHRNRKHFISWQGWVHGGATPFLHHSSRKRQNQKLQLQQR